MRSLLAFAVTTAVFTACREQPVARPPAETSTAPSAEAGPPAIDRSCKSKEDCVLVVSKCCPCTTGDWLGVNRNSQSAANDSMRAKLAACKSCNSQDCPPIDPACVKGMCVSVDR